MTAATDTVELAGGAVAACDVDGSLDSDGEDYTRPFELEEDGEEEYTPPSPRVMRASGVEMYKKGQWRRAYDIWSAGLKILLKDAVRGYIREDGRDLTLQYRLCMGQALMKLEQYTEALDQFAVVLDQDPEHIKALYHKALVLFALQDYDGCEATAKEGLAVEPDNKALLQTVNKAVLARHAHKKKQTNLFAIYRPCLSIWVQLYVCPCLIILTQYEYSLKTERTPCRASKATIVHRLSIVVPAPRMLFW
eukprot:Lankesteria_metandrocarpae@DN3895_c0_g1_i1.p1